MEHSEAELRALTEQGFVILRDVLVPAEVAELVAALAPLEAARPPGRNDFEGERSTRVYSLAGRGEVFMRLATHPRILSLGDALLMPNWLLSTLQSIRLYPGETAQPWHSDDLFYHWPRPRPILALSAIWALEDFTEANGATQLVPGSHRWGGEHPNDAAREMVTATMSAGSVLVFDGALWHRGGANRSAGTRLCISPQYCQPWLRTQESQLLICPPAVARHYPPRARAMLGYSIHPPFIGQVEGMSPQRLVDPEYSSHGRQHRNEAAVIADRMLARPTVEGT